jgi:hypothetical protein
MRNYKEQDPEYKERCFWLYQKLETRRETFATGQESRQQKKHAKQPTDRMPRISPSGFPVVRHASPGANHDGNE